MDVESIPIPAGEPGPNVRAVRSHARLHDAGNSFTMRYSTMLRRVNICRYEENDFLMRKTNA
ncbi:MAG: hypothetical protein KDH48_03150, partial [Rhodoferax sp.]|nr:hypothetical protein [Rhodoferax sp.]